MLIVIMLNVVMLSVVMLSVVALFTLLDGSTFLRVFKLLFCEIDKMVITLQIMRVGKKYSTYEV
jgi:hypothetical protein